MQTHRFISIATVCMLSNLVFVGCATVKIPPLAQGSGPVRVHVRGQFLQPAGKGFAGQVVTVLPVQSIQPNGVASFRETFLAGGKPGDPSTKTGPDGRFSIDATLSKGRYYAVMIGGQSGQPATPQNGPPVFSFGGEQREATVDYGVIRSVVVQTSYR